MANEERHRHYFYGEVSVGSERYIDGEEVFIPHISTDEVVALIEGMGPRERMHIDLSAPAVSLAAAHYGINTDDFIANSELYEHVRSEGCGEDLGALDPEVLRLIKERGIGHDIFDESSQEGFIPVLEGLPSTPAGEERERHRRHRKHHRARA